MILAIDMGNSNIVVGGLDDNKTYFEERITTDDRKTSLEYAILLKNILEIHKVKKNDIEGSIMASVVPPLNAPISSAVKKITGKKPFLVGSGMKTGLNIKMDNPKTVGGDRIVAAVAANAKYKGPVSYTHLNPSLLQSQTLITSRFFSSLIRIRSSPGQFLCNQSMICLLYTSRCV